jgi:hypothetical protein
LYNPLTKHYLFRATALFYCPARLTIRALHAYSAVYGSEEITAVDGTELIEPTFPVHIFLVI